MVRNKGRWIVGMAIAACFALAVYQFFGRAESATIVRLNGVVAIINTEGEFPPGQRDAAGGAGINFKIGLVGECLGAVSENAGGTVIVWPPGSQLESAGESVAVKVAGRRYVVGDEFTGTQTRFPATVEQSVPPTCRGYAVQGVRVP